MILTVDPGLLNWAFALFDEQGNLLYSETITYKGKKSQEERLYMIYEKLTESELYYDVVVCERQFVDIMGQITGVVRAAAGAQGAKSILYTPSAWKKAATGRGNIPEDELRELVVARYPELKDKSEHEIDTAGIYLAYLKKREENERK